MRRAIEAKAEFLPEINETISEDDFRTYQWNNKLKEVGIAWERWAVELTHD